MCSRRAQIPFGLVRGGRDTEVTGEAQDIVLAVAQAFQQVPAWLLLAAIDALDLAQAENDPMPEGAD